MFSSMLPIKVNATTAAEGLYIGFEIMNVVIEINTEEEGEVSENG